MKSFQLRHNCTKVAFEKTYSRLVTFKVLIVIENGAIRWAIYHFLLVVCGNKLTTTMITGSIARSANLPVFSLLRGRF